MSTIHFTSVSDLTPILPHFNPANGALHLRDAGGTVTVTCLPWTNIRTSQRVGLHIDGECVADEPVPALHDRLGRPPVFRLPAAQYFKPGQSYAIQLVVTEPDGSDNPNRASTRNLTVPVAA